jgi:transcriptional regulator with XRE-family HTH domain
MNDDTDIGRRLREIRSWRQLSLRATAELSGISYGYLGQIERGEKAVNNRQVLEAIALTLRVSPVELTGKPWAPTDPVGSDAHAALHGIEVALEGYELGHDPGCEARPWVELSAEVERLRELQYVYADYAAQGALVPVLLPELHATYVREPTLRQEILLGLIHCYASACFTTKRFGGRGLPTIAARLQMQAAEELAMPEWLGFTTVLRGAATGELSRSQQYRRSVRRAEELTPSLDRPEVAQAYGMLHLSAALAAAAQADRDTAETHLTEASALADRMEEEVGSFGRLWFGRTNVGIWRVSIGAEFGDGPKVAETARGVHPELIPTPVRHADFLIDLGRSMMLEPSTLTKGLAALLKAEQMAPQRVRTDVFVREAVADQLRRARREAGGRELRGLAWRMGVAPTR